jgi:hypothetical protein
MRKLQWCIFNDSDEGSSSKVLTGKRIKITEQRPVRHSNQAVFDDQMSKTFLPEAEELF